MKLNKHDAQTEMDMNMTPMIDVVFLLIIFFMIITDLTQKDLEVLVLPMAKSAAEDKPDPELVRPIINIPQRGAMIVKGEAKYDPERDGDDMTGLERYLATPQHLCVRPGCEFIARLGDRCRASDKDPVTYPYAAGKPI